MRACMLADGAHAAPGSSAASAARTHQWCSACLCSLRADTERMRHSAHVRLWLAVPPGGQAGRAGVRWQRCLQEPRGMVGVDSLVCTLQPLASAHATSRPCGHTAAQRRCRRAAYRQTSGLPHRPAARTAASCGGAGGGQPEYLDKPCRGTRSLPCGAESERATLWCSMQSPRQQRSWNIKRGG